jgi:serine/threonine-protein kinase
MLTPDGRTKLMDLGIARGIEGESITRASSILGTAGYVSPEQARGDPVDHRSDIYSLGCVLYEMLTGRPPFEAENPVAVAFQHVHEAPRPPSSLVPSIPPALEAVVLRAMEKDPAGRFPSVTDMTAALDEGTAPIPSVASTRPLPPVGAAHPSTASGTPTPPTETLPRRVDRPPRRRRTAMVLVLVLVAVLALLGGLAFALFGGETPAGRGGTTGSPSASASPSPSSSPTSSPSPSLSPSPSPTTAPPPDPVTAAAEAIFAVVEEGLADGRVSERAAETIVDDVNEALATFADGDTEGAMRKLEDLESKVDDLTDHDEVANQYEQRIDRALEDLWERFSLAAPPEDD